MQGTGIEPAKGLTRWVLSPVPLTARPPLLIKKSKKNIHLIILFSLDLNVTNSVFYCSALILIPLIFDFYCIEFD